MGLEAFLHRLLNLAMRITFSAIVTSAIVLVSCTQWRQVENKVSLKPLVVTEMVAHDSDDPAIWINGKNPGASLIIGTDKDSDGALYVFDLNGRILKDKTVHHLHRPNNVDIAYRLPTGDSAVDIAVVTERETHNLRVFSLPEMKAIDGGGIPVFEGETKEGYRDLMGIALYTAAPTNTIYAIVGRKSGPTADGYLWQYQLAADSGRAVRARLVRKFGKYSGKKEIESIAVDNELGYVYYSDEGVGVRKYYANPAAGNEELALFATDSFTQDHEGISIYKVNDGRGYILVSDQQANRFHIYPREGALGNPHEHKLIKTVWVSTTESDGSDVTNASLGERFPNGLFVAMSTDRTFQFYRWEDLAGEDLIIAPNGVLPSSRQ